MLTNEFLRELHNLSHADKLRIVQLLVNDLAADEPTILDPNTHYEVWSPYDSAGTAAALKQMLEEDRQSHSGG